MQTELKQAEMQANETKHKLEAILKYVCLWCVFNKLSFPSLTGRDREEQLIQIRNTYTFQAQQAERAVEEFKAQVI